MLQLNTGTHTQLMDYTRNEIIHIYSIVPPISGGRQRRIDWGPWGPPPPWWKPPPGYQSPWDMAAAAAAANSADNAGGNAAGNCANCAGNVAAAPKGDVKQVR